MDKELLKEINIAYNRLEMKQAEITHALFHRIFELESGWYNGHYHKGEDGNWFRESYPIPVIGAQFASTDCPFRMNGLSSSVEADWDLGENYYLFSGVRSRIFLPFISSR